MTTPQPTYTASTCHVAYQLNWSLSVFWRQCAEPMNRWLEALQEQTERDGVRILEHHFVDEHISQFLLSTTPSVAPAAAVRSIKGRLQHLVRNQTPLAFRRNYAIHSTGSANIEAVERYVASQNERHPMADPRTQEILSRFQFQSDCVDLSVERESAHGQFLNNLHIVLVYDGRGVEVREQWLQLLIDTLKRIAQKRTSSPPCQSRCRSHALVARVRRR